MDLDLEPGLKQREIALLGPILFPSMPGVQPFLEDNIVIGF